MRDNRRYRAYPSDLDLEQSFRLISEYFHECGYKEHATSCNQITLNLWLDDSRRLTVETFPQFLKVLGQHPHPAEVFLHTYWVAKNELICFGIYMCQSVLDVEVESEELNVLSGIHERIREIFKAAVPTPERSSAAARHPCKKTVFLAHRFDDVGRKASAIVNTFLRRLGFDVHEGEGYETRDVPDKVAERIRSQDIFMCLVTRGDSSWLLSEAAFAKSLGKYMILLLENGVSFNKGIIGSDYEHLPFPTGNVEKAFNDLLFALPS